MLTQYMLRWDTVTNAKYTDLLGDHSSAAIRKGQSSLPIERFSSRQIFASTYATVSIIVKPYLVSFLYRSPSPHVAFDY